MSGPPRKPPGPPPSAPIARPPPFDPNQVVRGVGGEINRPLGAPPGPPPAMAIKPPPMAPPPRNLMQTQQRPPPDSIKTVDPNNLNKKPIAPPNNPNASQQPNGAPPSTPGRGPPPRMMMPDYGDVQLSDNPNGISKPGAAPPKFNEASKPPQPSRKPGAVSMFQQPAAPPPQEPAPAKPQPLPQGVPRPGPPPRGPGAPSPQPNEPSADPTVAPMTRVPRPLPPRPQPAGIPEGMPLPPEEKPEKEIPNPAPVKPAPNRNRAPPREDPDAKPEKVVVKAPTTEAPFVKGRKVEVEKEYVPRRQRENPEFESSSSEEDEKGNKVKKKREKKPAKGAAPAAATTPAADQPPALVDEAPANVPAPAPAPAEVARAPSPEKTPAPTPAPAQRPASPEKVPRPAPEAATTAPQPAEPVVAPVVDKEVPPVDVSDEVLASDAIAPPPGDFELDFSSKLAKTLKNGRLSIRCIAGLDVRRKDDLNKVPRTDPYLRFKLGAAERHSWVTTQIKRKQDGNPRFDDEIVHFDVLDPVKFVMNEDLHLVIELWNKSTLKDECMGTVSMSVVRFFSKPFMSFEERVPLMYPNSRKSNGKLHLEFIFEEARCGMFAITLFEARGLRNVDPMSRQDPYVQLSLGAGYTKKSSVIKDGGTQPYFAEEELLVFTDPLNWVNDLEVAVLDKVVGMEKPIGITHICLLPYMNVKTDDATEETFDLFYTTMIDAETKNEVHSGEISLRIRFYPAGLLSVTFDRGKAICFPESYLASNSTVPRIDAYCQVTLEGRTTKMIKRSGADKDGGSDPVWNYEMSFDVVDQYMMELEVYHQSIHAGGSDVLLGSVSISLLPVFRNGANEFWTTLKQKKANGGAKEIGDVRVLMKFQGPLGVAFPQFRPDVDSFDDRMRKRPDAVVDVDEDEQDAQLIKEPISTIPSRRPAPPPPKLPTPSADQTGANVAPGTADAAAPPPPEFTESEIKAAFAFIDLDHNSFVGAKEIRHILVCMGEMVTDEEIDTMISLVDADGDGQVSYTEFRALVLHPDPGNADMHKVIVQKKDDQQLAEKQAMGGKTGGLELNAYQRQKELTQREAKKKMLVAFVAENEVSFDYIKTAFQYYADMPKERKIKGKIKFPDFCKALSVEPISEYRILHSLFDAEESHEVDFREVLLSMMNFIDVNKELRMRFSFTMFDDKKTGYITQKEIEEILRGNHMVSLASVQRKAETVMKQATATTSGSITMNELVVIAKKFPNILLPTIGPPK